MWVASRYTKVAIHSCYKSVDQKPVVDDRKGRFISYFRQDNCPSLSDSGRGSSHDVTTSDHLLMSQIRVSAVRQNWLSIASVYFPKNINPCLTSLKGTNKQQEEIGKMGEGLKSTQSFIKMEQIQQIYGVVGSLCSRADRKPCLPTWEAAVEPSSPWGARTTFKNHVIKMDWSHIISAEPE